MTSLEYYSKRIANIKMLSQQLQQLTSRIELEKQKGDMLESICLTLTTEG